MRTVTLSLCICLLAVSASAAPRIFVASSGTDTGACPRTAPCRTFAYAITQASSGSEVVALDTAGYGPVTIPFAVSIYAAPGEVASITAAGTAGVTIAAAPSDVVSVRNLFINSDGTQSGIDFSSGGAVVVDETTFSNVSCGVFTQRTSATDVVQVAVHNCRFAGATTGIYARSTSGSIYVLAKKCNFQRGSVGVSFSDHAYGVITDSTFNGLFHAIDAAPFGLQATAPVDGTVERSTFANNSIVFYAAGPSTVVRVGHSTITANTSPFAVFPPALVLSRSEGGSMTNTLQGNGDATTFSGFYAGK